MMIDPLSTMLTIAEKREAQIARVAEKIYSAAQSSAVYSEPVTTGNYTVITASEIAAGGGFGTGSGFGSPTIPPMQPGETAQPQAQSLNSAGGVGGGGGSSGRPVAIIIIGPDGVTVRPVVDVTRIALAGVTVGGAMVMRLWRMRKARRRMHV